MTLFESIFNHLVLPPKLPGQQDIDIEGIEQSILTRLIRACDTLGKFTGQQLGETWASVRHALRVCLKINPGCLEKVSMLQEFSNFQPKDLLILYVAKQNAALLVRHHMK